MKRKAKNSCRAASLALAQKERGSEGEREREREEISPMPKPQSPASTGSSAMAAVVCGFAKLIWQSSVEQRRAERTPVARTHTNANAEVVSTKLPDKQRVSQGLEVGALG